jgi:hypothetical protein
MLSITCDEIAGQLERDFHVPHPMRHLHGGLKRRDDREVTPFQRFVCKQRLRELTERGYDGIEGALVLMLRGARREDVAAAMGYKVNTRRPEDSEIGDFVADVRHAMRCGLLTDAMIGEAQRGLNLWRRA